MTAITKKEMVDVTLRLRCCRLLNHFEHLPYSRRLCVAMVCENIASSTETKTTEQPPQVRNSEMLMKF